MPELACILVVFFLVWMSPLKTMLSSCVQFESKALATLGAAHCCLHGKKILASCKMGCAAAMWQCKCAQCGQGLSLIHTAHAMWCKGNAWNLCVWMVVFTLHASNIKGKVFKFACMSCQRCACRCSMYTHRYWCETGLKIEGRKGKALLTHLQDTCMHAEHLAE